MNTTKLTTIKNSILNDAFNSGKYNSFAKLADDAEKMIDLVRIGNYGFASQVAESVMKYKKVSEKQAYIIAEAVEKNDLSTIDYMFEEEKEEVVEVEVCEPKHLEGEKVSTIKGEGVVVALKGNTALIQLKNGNKFYIINTK